jgi:hypothetical protein
MSLIPLIEDEAIYLRIFAEQTGYGMPRYRGSPMVGGSFWGRLVTFAKGLFRQAAPHVSDLISRAHPHVKGIASKAVETAIENAVSHVSEKLKKVQEGKSIKEKNKKKRAKRRTKVSYESDDNF